MGKTQNAKIKKNKYVQTTLAQNQKAKNTWENQKQQQTKQTKHIFKLVWPWAPSQSSLKHMFFVCLSYFPMCFFIC